MRRWWSTFQAVFRRELVGGLATPLIWVFLALFLFLSGAFFVLSIQAGADGSLRPLVGNQVLVAIFCIPLLTMRQLAGETQQGTSDLWLTSDSPISAVIFGKWASTMSVCAAVIAGWTPMLLAMMRFGSPDRLAMFSTCVGFWLCCGVLAASGLFASSLTRSPSVAVVGSLALTLPLWLVGTVPVPDWAAIGLLGRLHSFAVGNVDSRDLFWLIAVTGWFLGATYHSVGAREWR